MTAGYRKRLMEDYLESLRKRVCRDDYIEDEIRNYASQETPQVYRHKSAKIDINVMVDRISKLVEGESSNTQPALCQPTGNLKTKDVLSTERRRQEQYPHTIKNSTKQLWRPFQHLLDHPQKHLQHSGNRTFSQQSYITSSSLSHQQTYYILHNYPRPHYMRVYV